MQASTRLGLLLEPPPRRHGSPTAALSWWPGGCLDTPSSSARPLGGHAAASALTHHPQVLKHLAELRHSRR